MCFQGFGPCLYIRTTASKRLASCPAATSEIRIGGQFPPQLEYHNVLVICRQLMSIVTYPYMYLQYGGGPCNPTVKLQVFLLSKAIR